MSRPVSGRPSRTRRAHILVTAALLGSLGAVAAAVPGSALPASDSASEPARAASDAREDRVPPGRIINRIKRMSLEEKVGQLFVTYAYGETADTVDPRNQSAHGVDTAAELIDTYQLGGIIYFAWSDNLRNPQQIATLSNGIQETALEQRMRIPMLVSTDQEQGIVTRVGAPAARFPGSMALGAGRDPDNAYTAARITGAELRALGINQNYAPVADVNVNPENPVIGVRSFGEDPQLVADMTAAQVEGYQQSDGVAATAKHFPGHGDTNVDSHIGVPVINHSVDEWWELDAPPFQAAVEADVDAIMTAHIIVPALDPAEDPATLSRPIMTGVLREQLGYDGVVVTDALTMQGVRDEYGDERVPVLALQAGVDMLLMPPDIDLAYNAVLDAVRSGEISEERIDESVYRILRLKFERGLFEDPLVDVGAIDDVVGLPEHHDEAERITASTTTLVANEAGMLPLDTGDRDVLVTGWGASTTETLADTIGQRGATTETYWTGASPDQSAIDEATARAEANDLAVVTTMNAWTSDSQQELVKALEATGTPVAVIAVRDAYDIAHLDEVETYLATYSYTPGALEAATKVLFGEVSPSGRLPVTIPAAGDPDTALYPYGHGLSY